MKTRTKIINCLGGAGCGKSTFAAELFAMMKKEWFSVELVTEFAKELVWDEISVHHNQHYVFAKQFQRQYRLLDKVDFVITDCPLLLPAVYYDYTIQQEGNKYFTNSFKDDTINYFESAFLEFNNVNLVLRRPDRFEKNGRIHTKEQSELIDQMIINRLTFHGQDYELIDYDTFNFKLLIERLKALTNGSEFKH